MSTRHSFFLHEDEENKVTIHVFRELANFDMDEIRIEIETPHAVMNVLWPLKAYAVESLQQAKDGWFPEVLP